MLRKLGLLVCVGVAGVQGMAMACPHSKDQFICPGNRVVDSDGYLSTVLAVNPNKGTAAIRHNSSGSTYSNIRIQSLALGEGCVAGVCVGDDVVDSSGYPSEVLAVNPYNRTVALMHTSSGSIYANVPVSELALGLGCAAGICVGDQVVDSDGYESTILGINLYNQSVGLRHNSSGSVYANVRMDSLSVKNFCEQYGPGHPYRGLPARAPESRGFDYASKRKQVALPPVTVPKQPENSDNRRPGPGAGCTHTRDQFICPGNQVVDSDGYKSTVLGINPQARTAAIKHNSSGSIYSNIPIQSLALAEGCLAGVCVGDLAVDSSSYHSRILAVNPYNKTVAVEHLSSGSVYANQPINSIAIGWGCVAGVCVGDLVVDEDGYESTVLGVNPFNYTAGIRHNSSGSTYADIRIDSLSLSNVCEQYGDDHPYRRSRKGAPKIGDFDFGSKRRSWL